MKIPQKAQSAKIQFYFRKRPENPTQRAQSAATTLQKNWRKETDKVTQLKEEVRGLRTDEHIKHLTKELASAKQALERERKLRSLQMDAIKVRKKCYQNSFSFLKIVPNSLQILKFLSVSFKMKQFMI